MKEIPLTQGQVALVDDEDFDRVSKYNWSARKFSNGFYAYRGWVDSKTKKVKNHSLGVFLLNPPKGSVVDHLNGNPLDNRKSNLRVASKQQNTWNRSVCKTSTTGIKNVMPRKSKVDGRILNYRVGLMIDGKYKQFGPYSTVEEAVAVRNKILMEVRGELPHRKEFVGN